MTIQVRPHALSHARTHPCSPPRPQGRGGKRQTCASCHASKVKCDGALPCERCAKRGSECFYQPRKARKASSVVAGTAASAAAARPRKKQTSDEEALIEPLKPFERTALQAFFSVYKNYATPCTRFFITRQLVKLQAHFEKTGNTTYQALLAQWLKKLDIDLECVKSKHAGCMKAISNEHSWMYDIYVRGGLSHFHCDSAPISQRSLGSWELGMQPANHSMVEDAIPRLHFCDGHTIVVNDAFVKTFGVTSRDLVEALAWTGGEGLLPWGGDIFCRMGMSTDELLTYVSILALKVSSQKHPSALPSTRTTPNVNVFQLETAKGRYSCLVKQSLVEHMSHDGVALDLVATFELLDPIMAVPELDTESTGMTDSVSKLGGEEDIPVLDFPLDDTLDDEEFMQDLLDWAHLAPESAELR